MVRVYVTAPRDRAAYVRTIHAEIERLGCKPTSVWADLSLATTPTPINIERGKAHRVLWDISKAAIDEAHIVLALSDATRDLSEVCAEVGRAAVLNKTILWLGPAKILACHTTNVVMVQNIEVALQMIHAATAETFKDAVLAGPGSPACPKCGNLGTEPNPIGRGMDWYCVACHTLFDRLPEAVGA